MEQSVNPQTRLDSHSFVTVCEYEFVRRVREVRAVEVRRAVMPGQVVHEVIRGSLVVGGASLC